MTAFIQSREELERLLVTMNADGFSIRGLARHFSISRNMVRRILRKHKANRDHGHDILFKRARSVINMIDKMPRRLPILKYKGKRYFIDWRLREFRTVDPPLEFVPFDSELGREIDESWGD